MLQPDEVEVEIVVVVPSLRQKLSGTRMATAEYLPTFRAKLSVDQLHIPEEQVSW